MTAEPIRAAALAVLARAGTDGAKSLTRKAGSFLGQCVADPQPLTDAQAEWLDTLLTRNGFQPLNGGAQ